ncbi:MAG: hypothetical protein J7499_18835 [Sphingopyxis sp.]|nr:hypothetical protein [Sphingopyxis sp.]
MPLSRFTIRPSHLILIPACLALAACESSGSYRVGSVGATGATGASRWWLDGRSTDAAAVRTTFPAAQDRDCAAVR